MLRIRRVGPHVEIVAQGMRCCLQFVVFMIDMRSLNMIDLFFHHQLHFEWLMAAAVAAAYCIVRVQGRGYAELPLALIVFRERKKF